MSANQLPSSTQILEGFITRKLLLHNTPLITTHHDENSSPSGIILMLLSVLICGIICCLGLHYIIRCAFRCSSSTFMISEPITSTLSTPSSKGVKMKKALRMFPVASYSPEITNLPGLGEECVICLSEFVSGEKLRLLPKCNHGFHVRCIDKWLQQHLTCPKCRHCLVETCHKILGEPNQAPTTESIIVRIAPIEPEVRVNTFRESS